MRDLIRWFWLSAKVERLERKIRHMEQAITDLQAQVAALQAVADRAKPSPPSQDFTPQVQAVTATVKGVVDQLNAAFPAA